jgi:hypothetical protein
VTNIGVNFEFSQGFVAGNVRIKLEQKQTGDHEWLGVAMRQLDKQV